MYAQTVIAKNLADIRGRIAAAAEKSGRRAEDVALVAVVKNRPVGQIEALLACGQRVLGENRVQEALEKIPQLDSAIQWHLIGHLQTNKAKFAGHFDMIQSADSERVLDALNKEGAKQQRRIRALLQVNCSNEPQKFGCAPQDALGLFERCEELEWIQMEGLMTIGPLTADEQGARAAFQSLRSLKMGLLACGVEDERLAVLSMGMSADYEIAIEEGATMVRIGSAIFEGLPTED